MVSIKKEVAALLERLPEDCSWEDIQYHLYVLEKVHRGLEQVDRGEGIPHEEARERLRKWRLSADAAAGDEVPGSLEPAAGVG